MPVSKIEIINTAIVTVGGRPLETINDTTPMAETIRRIQDQVFDTVLGLHPWTCMTKTVALVQDGTYNGELLTTYRYTLPPMERILTVLDVNRDNYSDYTREGNFIYCNLGTIFLRYIFDFTGDAPIDTFLGSAISANFAWVLSKKITDASLDRDRLYTLWERALSRAKTADSHQNGNQTWLRGEMGGTNSFIESRGGIRTGANINV